MKGSVYDKIRADFNNPKKDRYPFRRGIDLGVRNYAPVIHKSENWRCGRISSERLKMASFKALNPAYYNTKKTFVKWMLNELPRDGITAHFSP
jgi:hypothetical protein